MRYAIAAGLVFAAAFLLDFKTGLGVVLLIGAFALYCDADSK